MTSLFTTLDRWQDELNLALPHATACRVIVAEFRSDVDNYRQALREELDECADMEAVDAVLKEPGEIPGGVLSEMRREQVAKRAQREDGVIYVQFGGRNV